MAATARDVMTSSLSTLEVDSPIGEAARLMRDEDIGDVLVCEGDRLVGIVTDRDIAIRAVADGRDPSSTPVQEICSDQLVTVSPETATDEVVRIMREKAMRRVPVVEGERPVGVISLGDLAVALDSGSVLGDISAAPPSI